MYSQYCTVYIHSSVLMHWQYITVKLNLVKIQGTILSDKRLSINTHSAIWAFCVIKFMKKTEYAYYPESCIQATRRKISFHKKSLLQLETTCLTDSSEVLFILQRNNLLLCENKNKEMGHNLALEDMHYCDICY